MKLIDLLVQELPTLGGWPDWADVACSQLVGRIMFYRDNGLIAGEFPRIDDGCTRQEDVSREQYEAAIAASHQPVWNGEGIPPVGALVELMDDSQSSTWGEVTIKFYGDAFAVWDDHGQEESNSLCHVRVRPIRTEADRKREETVNYINMNVDDMNESLAGNIYDLIASGDVPNLKLE